MRSVYEHQQLRVEYDELDRKKKTNSVSEETTFTVTPHLEERDVTDQTKLGVGDAVLVVRVERVHVAGHGPMESGEARGLLMLLLLLLLSGHHSLHEWSNGLVHELGELSGHPVEEDNAHELSLDEQNHAHSSGQWIGLLHQVDHCQPVDGHLAGDEDQQVRIVHPVGGQAEQERANVDAPRSGQNTPPIELTPSPSMACLATFGERIHQGHALVGTYLQYDLEPVRQWHDQRGDARERHDQRGQLEEANHLSDHLQ